MRILALDIGDKRIGVAAADDRTRVAIPVAAITVDGDPAEAIVRLVQEQQADELVIGLPLSLSGALGPQAQRIQALVEALAQRLSIPVLTWDERLTSVEADRRLAGVKPHGRRGRAAAASRARREGGRQDSLAAAIILQAYLDTRSGRGGRQASR
ncbi:MAG: Holliday junction resolvase RuvX [Chloroflexi bacterium]|nr:Holliday junction resolvase RuvX [Chloroflexota bacterium]